MMYDYKLHLVIRPHGLACGSSQYFAAVGFVIIGSGMGPIYPAIQHMAPTNFGKKYSASAIGLPVTLHHRWDIIR